jgi:ABC-type bacteriocin/lantibiotic exporter with double-glycine peptidase domain
VVALVQGGVKLVLNVYQGAVGERANRELRRRANDAVGRAAAPGEQGVEISIIVAEVEAVGGFVGQSVAELVLHGGVLVTVFGYLVHLQPWMALVAFGLFAPQVLFVPALQEAINRRTLRRIKILRALSVDIVQEAAEQATTRDQHSFRRHVADVYRLNMAIFRRKFGMNFLMNLLHHCGVAGILLVGGWFVIEGRTELGTVVAFISGLTRINDPWGDLVNYFRDMTNAGVKFRLIARAIDTRSDRARDR